MTIETSSKYRSAELTPEQNNEYRQRVLGVVMRWSAVDKKDKTEGRNRKVERILLSIVPESNLEHTDDMIDITYEMEDRCPNLTKAVNMDLVRPIIYFHDGGERLAGDVLAVQNDCKDTKEIKRDREQRAVNALTSYRYIKDQEKGQAIRDIYARYDNCRPEEGLGLDDKEALLTHLIDKVQAVRFGINNVVRQQPDQTNNLYFDPKFSGNNILRFTLPLLDALPDDASMRELIYFVYEEFEQFKQDFPEVAANGRQILIEYARNHRLEL